MFRILAGFLSFAYFARTFLQADDFSAPDGLIDHALVRHIFWFTRLGLFYPGLGKDTLKAIFLLGCLGSLALIVGWRVKLVAALLYVVAVSTYRWNFIVAYVDDSIVHLILFWLLLLPVGRTLILSQYLAEGRAVWPLWTAMRVPGATVRCFLWNFVLIYVVAGPWKLTSPLWRQGMAIAVVLRLPISFLPGLGQPEYLPLLILLDYFVIFIEFLVPLMVILPVDHRGKYAILFGLLVMHIGVLFTLDIPFANLACPAATVIVFRRELMLRLRGLANTTEASSKPGTIGPLGVVALGFVLTLTAAMMSSVTLPEWRAPLRPPQPRVLRPHADPGIDPSKPDGVEGLGPVQMIVFSALWAIGMAQQYQLFNWIDQRDYQIRYIVREKRPDGTLRIRDPAIFFPHSTRYVLLHSYLHGFVWMEVPRKRQDALRRSLAERLATRYCRRRHPRGEITIGVQIWKIDPYRLDPQDAPVAPFLGFTCVGSDPRITHFPGER